MENIKELNDEFDFETAYQELLTHANENGYAKDIIFQTLMKEFKRDKEMLDRMYEELKDNPIADMQEGSKGQYTYKSNPVIKDYIATQKVLVSTSESLKKYISDIGSNDGEDWLQ